MPGNIARLSWMLQRRTLAGSRALVLVARLSKCVASMNFVQFARCRAASEVPTVELGKPWKPSQTEIRETYLPMMERPDVMVISFTKMTHVHFAELKQRDGIVLTADDAGLERQYVLLSSQMMSNGCVEIVFWKLCVCVVC